MHLACPLIGESLNHRPAANRRAPLSYPSHTAWRGPAQRRLSTTSRALARHAYSDPTYTPSTTMGDQNHRAHRAWEAADYSTNTIPGPQAYYHAAPVPATRTNHDWGERAPASSTYAAALRRIPGEVGHAAPPDYGYGDSGDASQIYEGNNHRIKRKKVGCFKCGEFNHFQINCRFDHKVLCGACQRLGHKSRLCHHYST